MTDEWRGRSLGPLVKWLVPLLLALPVGVGLIGVALPAFGYLPALGGETFTLQPFGQLFAMPGLGASILLSLAGGLLTTAVSVLGVALFLAAFHGSAGERIARRALAPLLAVPHAAAAFGLAFLIAPAGLFFRLLAEPLGLDRPPDLLIVGDPFGLAMMAGLVAKEMPFLLLVAFAALPQADPVRRMQLSASLGYGRMAAFLLTVWPGVYRQIRLPVLAVAAYASGVVDVALILGPSLPAPLAVRLVAWMNDPDLSMRFVASAGALLQLAVTACVLLVWLACERLAGVLRRGVTASPRMAPRAWPQPFRSGFREAPSSSASPGCFSGRLPASGPFPTSCHRALTDRPGAAPCRTSPARSRPPFSSRSFRPAWRWFWSSSCWRRVAGSSTPRRQAPCVCRERWLG